MKVMWEEGKKKNGKEERKIRDIRQNIRLRWNGDINALLDYMCGLDFTKHVHQTWNDLELGIKHIHKAIYGST